MKAFEEAYAKLNAAQKEAVDAIEGPVMVIAGPGTGKTQILTLRIANILRKTDVPADAILALTFTEAAAANMRRRLVGMIGSRGYYVTISTFHGFSNRVIQDYPEHFPAIIGSQNAAEVDQIGIIRGILESGKFEHLKPFGDVYHHVPKILGAIRKLKQENFRPEAFRGAVELEEREFAEIPDLYHEKGAHKGKMKGEYQKALRDIQKNKELAEIYAGYTEELRARRLYDFEDMILEVAKALETREDFRLEMQERFQYILVDEHQDTNGAQNRILELLASFYDNPNLFVVGDEKQAIYRFQGASLENFLYFQKKYPEVRLVQLKENYRSTQSILDSAQSVIDNNRATIPAPLSARAAHPEKPIRVYPLAFPQAELNFLAEEIALRLAAGIPAGEIAVLYRENREAFAIADFLAKRGIPHAVESDQNILGDSDIRKLLLLLEAVHGFGNDEFLIRALHVDFLGIEPLDVYKLVELREHRRVPIYKVIARPERLEKIALEDPGRIHETYRKLRAWKLAAGNEPFLPFFERIVRESGFLTHLLSAPGYADKMEKLSALFEEIKGLVGNRGDYRLGHFIGHLAILTEHGVTIKAKSHRSPKAVRLMTAHRSKGLEFDTVFIAGACDGKWGNRRAHAEFRLPFGRPRGGALELNEDERRLFYMALTRARKEAIISYALQGSDGREQVPTQFIEEIRPELKEVCDGTAYEQNFLDNREVLFAPPRAAGPTLHDAEFLRELFLKRGLSATALNNYLECPWKYFYNNLVRIPRLQSRAQVYGSAAHHALEEFFRLKKDQPEIGKEFFLARFEDYLKKQPLAEADLAAMLAKGKKNLAAYFAHSAGSWSYNVLTEFRVQAAFGDDITLKGNLDKLEFQAEPGAVIVVDYKTGKPKSRNWIEGKTADSNGSYKRQLVFYRLLLDLYPEKKYRMTAGVLDFVEPNERGIFKKEAFEITDGETAELSETIRRAAKEILSLEFWDKRCGEKDCEYCALREMLPRPAAELSPEPIARP